MLFVDRVWLLVRVGVALVCSVMLVVVVGWRCRHVVDCCWFCCMLLLLV